jgi:hypothetical protein
MEPSNQYQQQQFTQQASLPNATAVLVLGIFSIIGCFCYGILGLIAGIITIVLANKDLALYRANPNNYTVGSYKNVNAGRTCAIIGLSLSAIYLLLVIILLITVGTAFLSNPGDILNNLPRS